MKTYEVIKSGKKFDAMNSLAGERVSVLYLPEPTNLLEPNDDPMRGPEKIAYERINLPDGSHCWLDAEARRLYDLCLEFFRVIPDFIKLTDTFTLTELGSTMSAQAVVPFNGVKVLATAQLIIYGDYHPSKGVYFEISMTRKRSVPE